jgi:hypothetical protein
VQTRPGSKQDNARKWTSPNGCGSERYGCGSEIGDAAVTSMTTTVTAAHKTRRDGLANPRCFDGPASCMRFGDSALARRQPEGGGRRFAANPKGIIIGDGGAIFWINAGTQTVMTARP